LFSPKIVQFQNGSNELAIELRVVQFWSEIILVISNQTCATRSFDFEITRMISDQIALPSVQIPLLRTVPTKYQGFCAKLGPRGKSRSLKGLLESTKKNWGSHAFFRDN